MSKISLQTSELT